MISCTLLRTSWFGQWNECWEMDVSQKKSQPPNNLAKNTDQKEDEMKVQVPLQWSFIYFKVLGPLSGSKGKRNSGPNIHFDRHNNNLYICQALLAEFDCCLFATNLQTSPARRLDGQGKLSTSVRVFDQKLLNLCVWCSGRSSPPDPDLKLLLVVFKKMIADPKNQKV